MYVKPTSEYLKAKAELEYQRNLLLDRQVQKMGLVHFWEDKPIPNRPIIIFGVREKFQLITKPDPSRWTFYDCTRWAFVDELSPNQLSEIKKELYQEEIEKIDKILLK